MKKFWCALFALLLLAACNKGNDTFVGHEYKLTDAPENAEITLGFAPEGGKFFGKAPVNRYFGSYTLTENEIKFGPIASTMMAGPEDMMKAETSYLRSLSEMKTFKIKDKQLILSNDNGNSLTFEEITKPQE